MLITTEDGQLIEQTSLPAWLTAALKNLAVAIQMATAPETPHLTHWGVKPGEEAAAVVASFAAAIAKELEFYGLTLKLPLLAAEAKSIHVAASQFNK